MDSTQEKLIKELGEIGINQNKTLKYKRVKLKVTNNFGKAEYEIKSNLLVKIIMFLIIVFVFSFVGVAIVAIIFEGQEKFVGFGIIPSLIMLLLINSISKSVTKMVFKKDLKEFSNIIDKIELQSIENDLKSKNPHFIEKLYKLKNTKKMSSQLKELEKYDYQEDFDFDLISKNEYEYLINLLDNKNE